MAEKKKKPLSIYKQVFAQQLGNVNRYRAALRKMIAAQEMGTEADATEAKESLEYNKGILHNALESEFYMKEDNEFVRNVQNYSRERFWRMCEDNLIGGDAELPAIE